ncbi:VanW family protein [Kamptonema cortianum]|nr:VanW family protein [Geitlerinema splendidum]MDK3156001.1 VanW family protein [Kamptonema cortianum]
MPKRTTHWAKKLLWITPISLIGIGAVAVGFLASQYEPKIYPEHRIGDFTVKGSKTDLDAELARWWDSHKNSEIEFSAEILGERSISLSLEELGATLDVEATKSQFSYTQFWDDLIGKYRDAQEPAVEVEPKIVFSASDLTRLEDFVEKHKPAKRPATAILVDGKIKLTPEVTTIEFDPAGMSAAIAAGLDNGSKAAIPLKQSEKTVSDEMLKKITTVASTFSTTFKESQVARSSNLRVAVKQLNGKILMPGDSFSFNEALGKRTTAKGYKLAGVYVSGRHDFDIGGGICQVSTTLYNAVLLAGLVADARSPHSLPVPYVPLGRDAAVSFPAPDFKFTNRWKTPLAITGHVESGKITFSILGAHKPEEEYQFVTKHISSWSHGEKIVHDASLPYGVRKVVDKGGSGRSVQTWKIVLRDGKEVDRIDMGVSSYRGGPKIVAVNTKAKAPDSAGGVVTIPPPAHEDSDGIGADGRR